MWRIKNNFIPETISKLFKEKDRTYGEGDNWKSHVPNAKLEIVKSVFFIKGQKDGMKFHQLQKTRKV